MIGLDLAPDPAVDSAIGAAVDSAIGPAVDSAIDSAFVDTERLPTLIELGARPASLERMLAWHAQ
ncbi:MAG TPA: hypothetical protein VGC42_10525, partial [Kofleriaceae bacterium]